MSWNCDKFVNHNETIWPWGNCLEVHLSQLCCEKNNQLANCPKACHDVYQKINPINHLSLLTIFTGSLLIFLCTVKAFKTCYRYFPKDKVLSFRSGVSQEESSLSFRSETSNISRNQHQPLTRYKLLKKSCKMSIPLILGVFLLAVGCFTLIELKDKRIKACVLACDHINSQLFF